MVAGATAALLLLSLVPSEAVEPAQPAETGVAILCDKVFTMNAEDEIFTPGMILLSGDKLVSIGPRGDVPEGYEVFEFEGGWATPGLVDIHTHVHTGGWGDINDMVRNVNPELRASAGMRPANRNLQIACSAGVTTLCGIPGSGTNIGGFGVLYKAKTSGGWDDVLVKDPGAMKVAQDSNPQASFGSGLWGVTRAGMSYSLEDVCDRALGALRENRFDLALENLKKVMSGEVPAIIHTAGSDGVMNTARMWKRKYNTRCCVSHGSFDGWKAARALAEWGMPVNHGPRTMDYSSSSNGRINGSSAEFVKAGVPLFSLNTDSSVMPQEEFFLQAAMSARLGADPYLMLRGITIHPAMTLGIDDRVGSLETGKDADIVIYLGNPIDPRSRVECVWIDGEVQYEYERGRQRF